MKMNFLATEYRHDNAGLYSSSRWVLPIVKTEVAGLPRKSIVVDLGCGNGSMLNQLRQYGFELHGIDMSKSGLAQAQKAYPDIDFSYADLTIDMSSHALAGRCDAIVSTEVIEHVFLPRVFAANCFSMLKPNGKLIISTPYHGYVKNVALAVTGRLDTHFTAMWDFGHIKFWSKRTLTMLLEEQRFSIERFHGAGRLPFLWKSMVLVAAKP